jgi:hypothetical protein
MDLFLAREEIIEDLLLQMQDFVDIHSSDISDPDFHNEFEETIKETAIEVFCCHHENNDINAFFQIKDNTDEWLERDEYEYFYVIDIIQEAFTIFYDTVYPRRSHVETFPSIYEGKHDFE